MPSGSWKNAWKQTPESIGVAPELDAAGLELGLRRLEVLDAELERVGVGLELLPERVRLNDRDRQVAGLELVPGMFPHCLPALEPEHLVVELHRPVDVGASR